MSRAVVCVIHNPTAGRGRGQQRLQRLQRILRGRAEFRPTAHAGHAAALARAAAAEGFPIVAAAGGDGTAHEVANGLLEADRPETIFAVLPVGSANDYAFALGLAEDWWTRPDAGVAVRAVDVGRVRSGASSRYFINGLGLGFNGAVTRQSRQLRRLRGLALYGLALARALCFDFSRPMTTVCVDGGPARNGPTLAVSLALGPREGNFVVAPEAVLDDGRFDYLHAGALRRRALLRFVPGLVVGRVPHAHPELWRGRCQRMTVSSVEPLTVHTDGEFFCLPADRCHELAIELLPRRLRVFARFPSRFLA